MSDHHNNHQRAAELHDIAAHAHSTAAQHGKQDYQTGQEASRQALEHSNKAYLQSQQAHNIAHDPHLRIATVAHELWQARGCPEGSPEHDWHEAVAQLKGGGR